jgi:hypothetical protein
MTLRIEANPGFASAYREEGLKQPPKKTIAPERRYVE